MVEEVQAWRDTTGKLHSTRLDAARADAVASLSQLDVFNHASAMAIVAKAAEITPILQQVLWAEEEAAVKESQ